MSGHRFQSHVAEYQLSGAVETCGSTGAEVPAELENIQPPQGWSSPETRDRSADPAVAQLNGEMHRDLPDMKRRIQRFTRLALHARSGDGNKKVRPEPKHRPSQQPVVRLPASRGSAQQAQTTRPRQQTCHWGQLHGRCNKSPSATDNHPRALTTTTVLDN